MESSVGEVHKSFDVVRGSRDSDLDISEYSPMLSLPKFEKAGIDYC